MVVVLFINVSRTLWTGAKPQRDEHNRQWNQEGRAKLDAIPLIGCPGGAQKGPIVLLALASSGGRRRSRLGLLIRAQDVWSWRDKLGKRENLRFRSPGSQSGRPRSTWRQQTARWTARRDLIPIERRRRRQG